MHTKIVSYIPCKKNDYYVEIFGYCSKSVPSLEIVGLGQAGRVIKEKFIFLSREKGLKFPLKRFKLCVDLPEEDLKVINKEGDLSWLELPMLLVFWSLTENLPIQKLDDCFSSGRVSLSGGITENKSINYEEEKLQKMGIRKYIGLDDEAFEDLFNINIFELLKELRVNGT
ncbi:hypothetical protein OAT67_01705 [Bacteriovoracaceae bacterium]|nr:hypothetical protein [Bacteriovoracaceae bacterium]